MRQNAGGRAGVSGMGERGEQRKKKTSQHKPSESPDPQISETQLNVRKKGKSDALSIFSMRIKSYSVPLEVDGQQIMAISDTLAGSAAVANIFFC